MCNFYNALHEEALQRMRELMGQLKLTVNEKKTRISKFPEGEFDFLGTRLAGLAIFLPVPWRHAY